MKHLVAFFASVPIILCWYPVPLLADFDTYRDARPIFIVPLEHNLVTNHLGRLKSGLLCLPAGSLDWPSIRQPTSNELETEISLRLSEVGFETARPEEIESQHSGPLTLKGVILEVKLDACVAGLGLGEMAPKGNGAIRVRWSLISTASGTLAQAERYEKFSLKGHDPRKSSEPMVRALAVSATKFMQSIPHEDRSSVID